MGWLWSINRTYSLFKFKKWNYGSTFRFYTAKFNFEFERSTHGFRIDSDDYTILEHDIFHTSDMINDRKNVLKIVAKPLTEGKEVKLFHKTYYRPKDFHDSRYDPSFSPILYPGQKIEGCIMIPEDICSEILACLYIKDGNSENYIEGEKNKLIPGKWEVLSFDIPSLRGACIEEAGIKFIPKKGNNITLVAYLDYFDFSGVPNYEIDFNKERTEVWNLLHHEVSQFTYFKGMWKLECGELSGSCSDIGEAYTGGWDWNNYAFEATIIPKIGNYHNINFRVQGAIRSYALGLAPDNELVLYKNINGYKVLYQTEFPWQQGKQYSLKVEVNGSEIKVLNNKKVLMEYIDNNNPYLYGSIGASVFKGSHCHYKDFIIRPVK